ncbi:MAG: hypothetical protein QOK05_21 [Chloroflexota bacterium]|jgi:hypothetical protein|nr:hypothetical protein [Chloroflexota bacterium]
MEKPHRIMATYTNWETGKGPGVAHLSCLCGSWSSSGQDLDQLTREMKDHDAGAAGVFLGKHPNWSGPLQGE